MGYVAKRPIGAAARPCLKDFVNVARETSFVTPRGVSLL